MVNAIQGLLATEDGTPLIPYVNPASKEEFGVVKVDNDTIKIDENGVITGTNVLIAGDNIEIENNVISAKNGAMPIGTIFPLNCTSNYVPEGCLPCDGAEYTKAQFEQLWDNYLTGASIINLYAFSLDLDNALCLYTTSPTPVSGEKVYELVNGQMVITSHIIAMITDESIIFESSTDGELYTTHRDITKDTNVIISNPLLNTCTYAEYEADLTNYGQCGKFAVKPLEYDGSKLTIVGSPTITEDGVASGFSVDDYLTLEADVDFNNGFVIEGKFNSGDITKEQALFSFTPSSGFLFIGVHSDGYPIIYFPNVSTVATWMKSSSKLIENTDYFFSFSYDNTGIKYSVATDKNSLNNSVFVSSDKLVNFTIPILSTKYIGRNVSGTYRLNGSIDLKQLSITADGQTVFSGGVGDTFKVPKIKDGAVVQQAMSDSELGKAYNAGLPIPPQHTHSPIVLTGSNDDDGDSGTLVVTSPSGSNGTHNMKNSVTGEATWNEDTIYDNSDTVQMNAVALRYFVVVANGTIEESAMNWSEWASSLQAKANKTDVDGQWVASVLTLSTAVAVGTYTFDLSDYLPKDGYNYDVKLFGFCLKEGSSPTEVIITTAIDTYTNKPTMATASQRSGRFYSIFTVGTDRTVNMSINVACASLELTACAYRRLGRNV